nr:ubiquitin carboxyl-terminal hydrolase 20-like [Tanacetum cinerariifolium]
MICTPDTWYKFDDSKVKYIRSICRGNNKQEAKERHSWREVVDVCGCGWGEGREEWREEVVDEGGGEGVGLGWRSAAISKTTEEKNSSIQQDNKLEPQLSDTYEPSVDLSLEIDSLSTALESFTKVKCIEDEEMKFTCDQCKEKVSLDKQLMLDQIPPICAFHLKRFKNDGYWVEKLDKHVDFPLEKTCSFILVAVRLTMLLVFLKLWCFKKKHTFSSMQKKAHVDLGEVFDKVAKDGVYVSIKLANQVDLSLEIVSLSTALESFTKVERIEDEEMKFTCDQCKEKASLDKQLMLDQIPPKNFKFADMERKRWGLRSAPISKTVEEKNSAIQQDNKLQQEPQRENVRKLFAYLNKHDTKSSIYLPMPSSPFLKSACVTLRKKYVGFDVSLGVWGSASEKVCTLFRRCELPPLRR